MQYSLFKSAKSFGYHLSSKINRTKIRQLHVKCSRGSPATLIVCLKQAHLVHPYLTRFWISRDVAHTNNHGLYLTQRRITHHRNLIVGFAWVVIGKLPVVWCTAQRLWLIASLFNFRKHRQVYVEHILFWPHRLTVYCRILVVLPLWSKLQRYLVFVVVALIVTAKAHKQCQLVVLQIGGVLLKSIGMNKHLNALIKSQIEIMVLVHCLCLIARQVLYGQVHSLLVLLNQLWLLWVCNTGDARRQHIVYWLLVVIFLYIHGAHLKSTAVTCSRIAKVLLIHAPLAANKVKASKAQNNRFLELS